MTTGAGEGMGASDLYAAMSILLSLMCLLLTIVYARSAVLTYRVHHDDRAAVALGKAIGLLVVALGLTISSGGLVWGGAQMATAGLSVARGALLVVMATLVLAGVRPGGTERET